jgi:hypothetical protein
MERWFGDNGSEKEGERPVYAGRLTAAGLEESEIELVSHTYRSQMLNQVVQWHSTLTLFVANK